MKQMIMILNNIGKLDKASYLTRYFMMMEYGQAREMVPFDKRPQCPLSFVFMMKEYCEEKRW